MAISVATQLKEIQLRLTVGTIVSLNQTDEYGEITFNDGKSIKCLWNDGIEDEIILDDRNAIWALREWNVI